MDLITVAAVTPFSPGAESATVALRKGRAEINAFCWPCSLIVGDVLVNRLSASDGELRAAYLSDWSNEAKAAASLKKLERTSDLSYRGTGRVVNMASGLVEVLGFMIDFGTVPCNGHVEFEISRLDIKT